MGLVASICSPTLVTKSPRIARNRVFELDFERVRITRSRVDVFWDPVWGGGSIFSFNCLIDGLDCICGLFGPEHTPLVGRLWYNGGSNWSCPKGIFVVIDTCSVLCCCLMTHVNALAGSSGSASISFLRCADLEPALASSCKFPLFGSAWLSKHPLPHDVN